MKLFMARAEYVKFILQKIVCKVNEISLSNFCFISFCVAICLVFLTVKKENINKKCSL